MHRSIAHGLRARNASGPAGSERSPTSTWRSLPPGRSSGLEHGHIERRVPLDQAVRDGETADAAPDDRDPSAQTRTSARWSRTTCARTSRYAGSAFGIRVRAKPMPGLLGDRLRLDVEVVQDLEVIGDEPRRAHDDRRMPGRRDLEQNLLDGRAPPRVGGAARALPRDQVVLDPDRVATRSAVVCRPSRYRHESAQSQCLQRSDPSGSDRTGSECALKITGGAVPLVGGEPVERLAHPGGQERHEHRMVVVAAGRTRSRCRRPDRPTLAGRARRRSRPTSPTSAAPSRCPPRARRDRRASAPRRRRRTEVSASSPGTRGRSRRRPRSAARRSRRPEPGWYPAAGRRSRSRRSARELVQMLGGRRPSAADVGVVALDVVGAARGPVGHHEHADPERRRFTCAFGLRRARGRPAARAFRPASAGSTPWPEVEDVPVAAAGTARARRAPCRERPPTARAAPPGRGSPGRRGRDRPDPMPRPGARDGRRRSRRRRPRASAPSSSPVPTPKWIVGHAGVAQRREDPADVRLDVARVVIGRERADPRVEDLERLRAGLHLGAQVRDDDRGERGASARPTRRARPASAPSSRAWSRDGPPSTR